MWFGQLLDGGRRALGDADTAQPSPHAQLGYADVPVPLYR